MYIELGTNLWFGSHWIGIRRLELEKKMYIMNHRDLWPFVPYQRPLSDSVVCLRPAWISDLKEKQINHICLFFLNNPISYSKKPKFVPTQGSLKFWVVFWSQLTYIPNLLVPKGSFFWLLAVLFCPIYWYLAILITTFTDQNFLWIYYLVRLLTADHYCIEIWFRFRAWSLLSPIFHSIYCIRRVSL